MEPLLIFLSIVILVVFVKTRKTRQRVSSMINKLPGPPSLPLFGNSLQFIGVKSHDRMRVVVERDIQYGPIYRNWMINLPYVHIASAELAEVVLNLKDTKKGQVYTFLMPWLGSGLLTASGAEWARSRKLITPTFHFNILYSFLESFNKNGEALTSKFLEQADTGKPVNIYPILTLALLDAINETAMGNSIHALENSDSVYVKAVYDILHLVFYRYDHVWLHNELIYRLSPTGRKTKKTLKILHDFTESTIKKRMHEREIEKKTMNCPGEEIAGGEKRSKAFLDLLLDECEKQNAEFSARQVRDEVTTFMFEGHDTSTATLSFSLFMMAHHPELQEQLYEEQLAIQGDRSDDWRPAMRDLNEMKMLERFIKETLRMYPPIPFISRTLTKDVKIGDYMIPEGSVTLISLVSILKDPKHFPNPEHFDPDRFLPENAAGRYAYAHIPFSAGPRNCIGSRFAMATMKTFLSHIVRQLQILPVTTREEFQTVIEIVQKPLTKLEVLFVKRK